MPLSNKVKIKYPIPGKSSTPQACDISATFFTLNPLINKQQSKKIFCDKNEIFSILLFKFEKANTPDYATENYTPQK